MAAAGAVVGLPVGVAKEDVAQAVVTGNWGNDLTLLVKAAREVGFDGSFYTFYGNALGAPAAIGDAGVGKVVALAQFSESPENQVGVAGAIQDGIWL